MLTVGIGLTLIASQFSRQTFAVGRRVARGVDGPRQLLAVCIRLGTVGSQLPITDRQLLALTDQLAQHGGVPGQTVAPGMQPPPGLDVHVIDMDERIGARTGIFENRRQFRQAEFGRMGQIADRA